MDRRLFIYSLCTLGMSAGVNLSEGLSLLGSKSLLAANEDVQLKANSACHAMPGKEHSLPLHPQDGEFIQFIVNKESLQSPSKVISHSSKIVGAAEPLELDQLAIFKLVYSKKTNNWSVG